MMKRIMVHIPLKYTFIRDKYETIVVATATQQHVRIFHTEQCAMMIFTSNLSPV
jgi:hypothetical protein